MKITVDKEWQQVIQVLLDVYTRTKWIEAIQDVNYILSNLQLQDDNNTNNVNSWDNPDWNEWVKEWPDNNWE